MKTEKVFPSIRDGWTSDLGFLLVVYFVQDLLALLYPVILLLLYAPQLATLTWQ